MNQLNGFCMASMAIPVLLAVATSPQAVGQCDLIGWSQVGGATNPPPGTTLAYTVLSTSEVPIGESSIYVGGQFGGFAGVQARAVVRWNGTQWLPLGTGLTPGGTVAKAMCVFDDGGGQGPALYVGGSFSVAGGVSAPNIARWTGSAWQAVGAGFNGQVRALRVFDDGSGGGPALYAGGAFTISGPTQVNYVARWNGTSWQALASGVGGPVNALTVHDADDGQGPGLYVGGLFNSIPQIAFNCIARWDGTTWSALGTGVDAEVFALASFESGPLHGLYAGGSFATAGGTNALHVARWTNGKWTALCGAEHLDFSDAQSVRALLPYQEADRAMLYIGFSGGVHFPFDRDEWIGIMRWDGSRWLSLGSSTGFPPSVYGLAVHSDGTNDSVLAVGQFKSAGGMPAGPIASWYPAGPFDDCNHNRLIDECELVSVGANDCDSNGEPDECSAPWRYVLDAGEDWTAWGNQLGMTNEYLFLNQFTIQPGSEIITHVGIPWSPYGPQGWPVDVLLYSDPNGDGNPHDAVLLASASPQYMPNHDTLAELEYGRVPIGPVHIGPPGTSFFVAGFVPSLSDSFFMVADQSPAIGRSFVRSGNQGSVDLTTPFDHLQFMPNPLTVNWRLRALSIDCNGNGTWDLCDIDDGVSIDINRDGIPDECQTTCAADVSPPGDGVVNIIDLLFIIANWGTANGPADINDDGAVNIQDLLAVITAWGPC